MKKILFSLAFVAFLCVSCSKGDASSASASEADTTAVAADTKAAPSGIPSIPRDAQATKPSALEININALVNSIQYDSEGHTNISNQTELAKKYGTKSFQQRSKKTISYDLNVFGPNWQDFCSDGSEKIRHVKAKVTSISDNGDTQTVKVKFSYDRYRDYDFTGNLVMEGHCSDTYVYKMANEGGEWKVNDVLLQGDSMCKRWEYLP